MELKIQIHQNIYSAHLVQGVPIGEEFNENLDNASIIISKVKKMTLEPLDDVILFSEDRTFKKHMLVGNYSATMLNLTSGLFKYTIDIISETKGLEKIVLPNIVFKQPLLDSSKKTLYEVILQYIQTYTPKRKYNIGNHKWEYRDKYTLTDDASFVEKTKSIFCPEFCLTKPTLRELLNYLFSVIDYLPTVNDNVVSYIDLSKPTASFSFSEHENYISYSKTAENYSMQLIKDYDQGIGDNSISHSIEYIGFRNFEDPTLKLDNLRLQTQFPIYSINKVYMYLYKKLNIYRPSSGGADERTVPVLIEFDITDFIKSSEERNLLDPNYVLSSFPAVDRSNDSAKRKSIEELTKYQIMTLPFNRGNRNIDGWGFKWGYFDPEVPTGTLGWTKKGVTFLENLINFMGYLYPYGTSENSNSMQSHLPSGWFMDENESIVKNLYDYVETQMYSPSLDDRQLNVPATVVDLPRKLKSVFFKFDYQPISSARVKIHKKNEFVEEFENVDNQSNGLVSLETDGENSLYKAARLANELLEINGRYTDLNDMLPLGAKNSDGYIIFKRSFSIYGNEIRANYAATKDYIIKNYFTSVWSKKRNTTLLSTESSSIRNENETIYVFLSHDKAFYDDISLNFNNIDTYDALFSSFTEKENIFINVGIISYNNEKYVQEINSFIVSRYIMCFDFQMQGNASAGTYISDFWPLSDMIKNQKVEAMGCLQSNYVVANYETGFTDVITFSIGHISTTTNALQPSYVTDSSESAALNYVNTVFNDLILKMPKFNNEYQRIDFEISTNNNRWKNNGEIINFNYQIDFSNVDENIYIGKEFLPLNEMIRSKEKIFETYYETTGPFSINSMFSVIDITSATIWSQTSRPVLILNIPDNMVESLSNWFLNGGSALPINSTYTFRGTNQGNVNPVLDNNFSIEIKLLEMTDFNSTQISLSYEAKRTTRDGTSSTKSGTYIFKRFGTGSSTDNAIFQEINDYDNSASYGWAALYEDDLDFYGTDMQNGNPKFLWYGGATFSYDSDRNFKNYLTSDILVAGIADYNKPHYKNCYVFNNDSAFVFDTFNSTRTFSRSELEKLGFYESNLKMNEAFGLQTDNQNRHVLRVRSENATTKSVSCFYKNNNNTYTLIFASNHTKNIISGQIYREKNITNLFNGTIIIPLVQADSYNTQNLNILKPDNLVWDIYGPSSLISEYAGRILFEAGKEYCFAFKSDGNLFFDDNLIKNRLVIITPIDNTSAAEEAIYDGEDYTKAFWLCNKTGYYTVNVFFTPQSITSQINLSVSFMFFETDDTETEQEIDVLWNNGTIIRNIPINVFYTDLYISVLTNLNNRVYDDNNMLLGINKNWYDMTQGENIDNSFIDLADNNEGD